MGIPKEGWVGASVDGMGFSNRQPSRDQRLFGRARLGRPTAPPFCIIGPALRPTGIDGVKVGARLVTVSCIGRTADGTDCRWEYPVLKEGVGFWTGCGVWRGVTKLRVGLAVVGIVGVRVDGEGRTGRVDGVVSPGVVTGVALARGCARIPVDAPGQFAVEDGVCRTGAVADCPGYWTAGRTGVARAMVVPGATEVAGLLPPAVRIGVSVEAAGRVASLPEEATPGVVAVLGRSPSSWMGDGVRFMPGAVGVDPAVAALPGRLGRLELPAPWIVVRVEPGRDRSRDTVTAPLFARSWPMLGL